MAVQFPWIGNDEPKL